MTDDVSSHDATDRSQPDGDSDTGPPEPDISPCYQAYLERHDGRSDSCTIYSAVTADTPRYQWIRAWGDAFVSREDAR